MFLLRSAFWLAIAFIIVHPRDVDLGARASELSGQALQAGQRVVIGEILKQPCALVACPAAIAHDAPARQPAVAVRSPGDQNSPPVPFPRPAWLG